MRHVFLLLVIAGLGLVNPLYARTQVEPLDRILVVVNDDVITQAELEQRLKLILKQLQGRNTRLPPENVLKQQVLERMIVEKVQLQTAEQSGIRADEETINRVIENIARENRMSMEQFQQRLKKDNFSFEDFRNNIRNEILITRLRQIQVEQKVSVSEQEIDNYLSTSKSSSRNEEYRLGHILIAIPEAASPAQIELAQTQAQQVLQKLLQGADFSETAVAVSNDELALKGGDLGWRNAGQLPTLFADQVPNMQQGEMIGPLRSASGFHIVKMLDKRSSQGRHMVTQTLARHILIKPGENLSQNEARDRLIKMRQRILKGEDFATLAGRHSEDKGSAIDGGSLGWVSPGMMVPEFEKAMNSTAPGEISAPFQTNYGWHIVQVLSRRKHDDTQSLQRTEARKLLHQRKTEEAVQDWLRRLRAEAYVEYLINQ